VFRIQPEDMTTKMREKPIGEGNSLWKLALEMKDPDAIDVSIAIYIVPCWPDVVTTTGWTIKHA